MAHWTFEVSSRLGIDRTIPFIHLRTVVARSPHAVSRWCRAVRPAGMVTAVRTRPFWPRWIYQRGPLDRQKISGGTARPDDEVRNISGSPDGESWISRIPQPIQGDYGRLGERPGRLNVLVQ
jgi:hypothetical protein